MRRIGTADNFVAVATVSVAIIGCRLQGGARGNLRSVDESPDHSSIADFFVMAVVSKTKNDEAGADGKLPWAMQILPCLIQANVGIQIQIMSPLFVPMARQFSSDVVQQNSMVNARPSLSSCAGLTTRPQVVTLNALYYWICGFSGLLWGWVADRFGRRVALLGGLVATTLAMAMMSVSTTYGMAIAARIVMGFDANLGINKAYVGDLVKGKNAGRLFSNMMSSLSIGFALGPLIASRLPGLVIPGWLSETRPSNVHHANDRLQVRTASRPLSGPVSSLALSPLSFSSSVSSCYRKQTRSPT